MSKKSSEVRVFPSTKKTGLWLLGLYLVLASYGMSLPLAATCPLDHEHDSSMKERIELSVKWSFIPLIRIHLETHELQSETDPRYYRLTQQSALNTIWNDRMASIIDSESLLPCQMETTTGKGRKALSERVVFDRDLGIALVSSQKPPDPHGPPDSLHISETAMDPLSAFYYLRKRLSPATSFLELKGVTGSRRFVLRGRLVEEERIRVPVGVFPTYRLECEFEYWSHEDQGDFDGVEPRAKELRPFTLWVSRDSHRFPIQIRYHLPLGSLWVRATSLETSDQT